MHDPLRSSRLVKVEGDRPALSERPIVDGADNSGELDSPGWERLVVFRRLFSNRHLDAG
jgi:hypothetical protein